MTLVVGEGGESEAYRRFDSVTESIYRLGGAAKPQGYFILLRYIVSRHVCLYHSDDMTLHKKYLTYNLRSTPNSCTGFGK